MLASEIPLGFGDDFLDWFRERTEAAWTTYQPRVLLTQSAGQGGARAAGFDWQPGSHWTGGLSEAQIAEAERWWGVCFPPDYRRFLAKLHTIDRPMRGLRFEPALGGHGAMRGRLVVAERAPLPNWLCDGAALREQLTWLTDGLRFDVERNAVWLPGWGARPTTEQERSERITTLVRRAPQLVPLAARRYLLAEPLREGNPALSIYQSDVTVCAPDLRSYLLITFASVLGIDARLANVRAADAVRERAVGYHLLPFWGELIAFSAR